MLCICNAVEGPSLGVDLPVQVLVLRESGGKLVPVNAQDASLAVQPISLVPGDRVEIELVPIRGIDPTKDITLAQWKVEWEWKKKKWVVLSQPVSQTVVVTKRGKLGKELIVNVRIPGVTQDFSLAPQQRRQFGGQSLSAGTLAIFGVVGSLDPGDEGKPNGKAAKKHQERVPNVGIENQPMFCLRIFIRRAATNN